MFPIPSAYYILITNPLKLIITKISTHIIYILGIPVYREGNLLFLSTTQLEVAEACSGIRSLYSYLMLACLFAFMSKNRISQMVLLLSTIPLAIFVNILRVTGTAILANYFGSDIAQGFFHEFTGFLLFATGFFFLFIVYYLFERMSFTKKS
jgi:exosortase